MKTFNELRDGELCGYCLKTDRGKQSEIHSSSGVSLCEGFYCEDAYRTYIEETTDDMNQTSKEIELITKFVNEGVHVYGGEIRRERVLSYLKRLLVVSNKEYEANKHYIELGKAVEYAVQNEIRFIRQMTNGEKLAFIDKYDKAKLLKIYNEILEKNKNNKVPNECYLLYGEDLDKCSTQSNEGCGRCILYNKLK